VECPPWGHSRTLCEGLPEAEMHSRADAGRPLYEFTPSFYLVAVRARISEAREVGRGWRWWRFGRVEGDGRNCRVGRDAGWADSAFATSGDAATTGMVGFVVSIFGSGGLEGSIFAASSLPAEPWPPRPSRHQPLQLRLRQLRLSRASRNVSEGPGALDTIVTVCHVGNRMADIG
jgi:hypothetical protein